jgi:hypothetical protein
VVALVEMEMAEAEAVEASECQLFQYLQQLFLLQ